MPEISEADLQSLNDAKTELATLKESGGKVQGEIDTLKTAKVELERKLDDADKELLSETYLDFKSGKGKPKGGEEESGEFDFDRASGKEIATHLRNASKKELETAIKGMSDRIAKGEEQMSIAFAQLDVTITALTNKDFTPNKDAIYAIAKANPNWGAEKCLKQWRMENETAISKKAADDKKKAEDDAKLLAEKGEGVPLSTTTDKELTKEEAGDAAYNATFGNAEKA